MIKDALLKVIFVPLLGIGLPIISGIVTYKLYSVPELVAANFFFILTSFAIWAGCNWIHVSLRPLYSPVSKLYLKIATVCFASALYGGSIGGLSTFIWIKMSRETFNWNGISKFIAVCVAAVILFTLLYEILFLSKEREIDNKIVDQLDKERSQAELQALTNEMDPHFIFNSLNTLNHLIVNRPQQAHLFNNKLAQVYKYFLINKTRELISLKDEMEFIDDYFFLLQIRHDGKLHLHVDLNEENNKAMIPPCALQVLIENAIKHNEFTEDNPLHIKISMNGHYIRVSNNAKPKPYAINSTGIGLKNLSSRYRIISKKNIEIEKGRDNFTVKLPLIR
ncbi:MAG: histidine kinase [Bacteroidetes bacterium]|jgi:sensor histidine kinase YesM|nr:MAG: histidine kinase [Bacteroidota bacterium]